MQEKMAAKTLGNTDISGARENVPDIVVYGNGDAFELICKASSEAEGWMKSTKAMEIPSVGCLVQVTTQQRNADGSYAVAEALTFVPGVCIHRYHHGTGRKPTHRRLVCNATASKEPGPGRFPE